MKTPKEKDIKNYLTINEYEHLRKCKICRNIKEKAIQETAKDIFKEIEEHRTSIGQLECICIFENDYLKFKQKFIKGETNENEIHKKHNRKNRIC